MNVEFFLDDVETGRESLERILSAYPELFPVRWHTRREVQRWTQLYLASLPLDASTGHWLASEERRPVTGGYGGYGNYGYSLGGSVHLQLPAVALFDRIALLPAAGGPPRRLRPGVWQVPFGAEDLLRAAFHQAFEAALAELREAYTQLRATHPGLLELPLAARLLQVTPASLRRAIRQT